jgi:hypothetical protein
MSLTTSLLFRTLATLEGTPEHPVPWLPTRAGRRGLRQRLVGQRLVPATWEQTAKQELVTPSRQQSVRGPSRTAKSRSSRAPGTS